MDAELKSKRQEQLKYNFIREFSTGAYFVNRLEELLRAYD